MENKIKTKADIEEISMGEDHSSEDSWEPVLVGFCCNWCSYAGADLAGVSREQYPSNLNIIKVMCSGRVSSEMVLKAFQEGADGVLVSGCHPGDCHYLEGNYYRRRGITLLHDFLDFMGIDSERLKLAWISGAEGGKFAKVVTEFTETVRDLGPLEDFQRGVEE